MMTACVSVILGMMEGTTAAATAAKMHTVFRIHEAIVELLSLGKAAWLDAPPIHPAHVNGTGGITKKLKIN
jgi:hypothetical protein